MKSGDEALPLAGLTIIDLTSVLLGPFATLLLAQMGATVIKVESPAGDITRAIAPTRTPGLSALFMNCNRGKRSLALDLKDPRGLEVLLRLTEGADVFFHSMRAKAADRLGIGETALRARKPDIIYCGAWGFDQQGPYADLPAYDDIVQAVSGIAHLLADDQGEPRYIPTVMVDKITGLYAANAMLAAVVKRQATGRGSSIEVPMLECIIHFIMAEHLAAATYEPPLGPPGYERILAASRRPYRTKDSHVATLPYTTAHWLRLLAAIGREDLAGEDWVRSSSLRSQRIGELYDLLRDVAPQKTTAEWMVLLRRLDIPVMPVSDLADVLTNEQLVGSGLFEHYDHPTEGALSGVRLPVRFAGAATGEAMRARQLGADTADILGSLGYDVDAIAALVADGVALTAD